MAYIRAKVSDEIHRKLKMMALKDKKPFMVWLVDLLKSIASQEEK